MSFNSPFYIRRKRYVYAVPFLMYLDGRYSVDGEWPDSDGEIEVTGAMQLAPYGFLPSDDTPLNGNLGVDGDTITAFTIAVVLCRDEMANVEEPFSSIFGSSGRPSLLFDGTDLIASVRLDGANKTITVANVATYLKPGQPHFIVLRGSASTGIELLIDNVVRGVQTDTGTDFDVGTDDFELGDEMIGALRFVAVCAQKMTDAQLSVWRSMLAYEGIFDVWGDDFAKWSGSTSFSSGVATVSGVPYQATIIEM